MYANANYLNELDILISTVNSNLSINNIENNSNESVASYIASIHNNLGNTKQFLSGIETAANGADQNFMIVGAQNSLQKLIYEFNNIRHLNVISYENYQELNELTLDLIETLSSISDSDYN